MKLEEEISRLIQDLKTAELEARAEAAKQFQKADILLNIRRALEFAWDKSDDTK